MQQDYRKWLWWVAVGLWIAVVLGFSSHGTFLYGEYISGDSPWGVVKWTRRALEEETGVPVVVFHDNTCGGDTSPAGGMFDVAEDYGGVADYAGINSLEWTGDAARFSNQVV